jgi:hypothetical protein
LEPTAAPPSSEPEPGTGETPAGDETTPVDTVAPSTSAPAPAPAEKVTLGANGLGNFEFGAKEADVMAWLNTRFGEPSDSYKGIMCELDSESPYGVSLTYDALTVTFMAKDQKKTSARTLEGWQYQLNGKLPADFGLADGIDPSQTFTQLQKKYPKSTLEDTGMSYILTLPNKIRLYAQVEADLADMIESGYDGSGCE